MDHFFSVFIQAPAKYQKWNSNFLLSESRYISISFYSVVVIANILFPRH